MSKIYYNNKLDLSSWRAIVQQSGDEMEIGNCQTITPFGFEVTNDKNYLSKNINRFYCYFGNKFIKDRSIVFEEKFASILLKNIKYNDIDFYKRISVIIFEKDDRKIKILNDSNETSIVINVEHRIIEKNLITDYAEFLACCLFEIENGTLSEFNRYHDNLNVRNRCYQLYLIIEYATQYLQLPFTQQEKIVFDSLHKLNKSPIEHYHTSKNYLESNQKEKEILEIIKKRINKIYWSVLEKSDQKTHVCVKSYNSDAILTHRLPSEFYMNFINYIENTYKNFAL